MIDREQVLHVARLSRLELSDDEVGKMASELSSVLGHIEKIGELDLDGVPPTSHVVEVANALRPDVATPCLPREVALAQAPAVQDDGFLVPSPQAGGGA
jgi:aspartyl-tRNA(Asn)/glutamyl-tRNA(Gln) amidotransferase subunit C